MPLLELIFFQILFFFSLSLSLSQKRELRVRGRGEKKREEKGESFPTKTFRFLEVRKRISPRYIYISLWGFSFLIYQQTNGKGGCKFFIYTKKTWNRTKLLQKGKVTFDERRRRGLFFKMKERERNYIYSFFFLPEKKKTLSFLPRGKIKIRKQRCFSKQKTTDCAMGKGIYCIYIYICNIIVSLFLLAFLCKENKKGNNHIFFMKKTFLLQKKKKRKDLFRETRE